jgi:protein phosphatase
MKKPSNGTENPANKDTSSRWSIRKLLRSLTSRATGTAPEKAEAPVSNQPEILDGAGVNSLAEGIREYETASGDKIWASTDEGVDYSKGINEDRVAVSPANNMAAVIDGMGGQDQGDVAAQCVAEAFLKYPDNTINAVQHASELMHLAQIDEDGGACFASARIIDQDGQKSVEIAKTGDVKALIFEDGKFTFESHDDSFVQVLIDSRSITLEESYYNPYRNIVNKPITPKKFEIELIKPIPVKKGSFIILLSDGIMDNIALQEIARLIQGLTPRQIIQTLSDITGKRMANKGDILDKTEAMGGRTDLTKYSDGFLTTPKQDNRGIVIIEIN